MDRKKLSTLGKHFTLRVGADSNHRGRYIQFHTLDAPSKMVFQVEVDDLFDADGNRFEDDLA